MRIYKINLILLALIGFVFYSCDQEPKGAILDIDSGKASFLAPNYSPAMTDDDGSKILVPIGRTGSEGTLSVPVTLTATGAGYTDVFKVVSPATFESGNASSNVVVNYNDLSKISSGMAVSADATSSTGKDIIVMLAFPFNLSITDEALLSPSKVESVAVNATKRLNFESIGNAVLNSVDGWWEEEYEVEVHKAIGANVYKLISPFGFRDIAFMISPDGKTATFPNQIIYNHATYGHVTMGTVKGAVDGKVVTLTVGAYTVSAGSFGGGIEIITLP